MDEILKQAERELDDNRRKALYSEFQQILTEELRIVWINVLPFHTVYHALKRAFPPEDARGGEVRVVLHSPGSGWLSLMVSDDGVGIPPEVDLQALQTLGLQLVDLLTQQLEGTLELDRDGGTAFVISFPDRGAKLAVLRVYSNLICPCT